MNSGNAEKTHLVFVSMPYGKDKQSKEYWARFFQYAILGMAPLFDGRGYKISFIRPKEHPQALALKESVVKEIRRSDFLLAVITGSNPNVFFEVGFAESLGKPVIFVTEASLDEGLHSPVLVSESLKVTYDGTLYDQIKPDEPLISQFHYELLPFFSIAHDLVANKKPYFTIYGQRDDVKLAQLIHDAQKEIDIITTNLSYFADKEKFSITEGKKKVFAFDPPVQRNIPIRILTLNPDSLITEYRAKQLGKEHDVSGYREELRAAAEFFFQRYELNKNVDLRIYDDLPLQITIKIDDTIITSFVSRGHPARENIHAEFDINYPGARRSFEEHFAEVLANQQQTVHISKFAWAQKKKKRENKKSLLRRNSGE